MRFKNITLHLLVFSACLFVLIGCNQQNKLDADGKLIVTTTTGMIADAVQQIGGQHVHVTALMKPGVDPHLFKASQGDIGKLNRAEVIFYNGLHLEGKMIEILEQMAKKKEVIAVSDKIDRSKLRSGAEMATEYDPHIWFDVELWMSVTQLIRDTLIEVDPEHEEDFRQQADDYLAQLNILHQETIEQIRTIPEASRILVTAHDAFGYFGDAYGMVVKGLQGMSTASEAGTKDVTDLRDYLIDHQIKAIFIESSVPRKSIDAVIQGAQQKGHDLKIGGELFSDAMGKEGTVEGTYIGMIRHNVSTIVNALK